MLQFALFPASNPHLLLHNLLFLAGGFINIILIIFLLIVRRKQIDLSVGIFSLLFLMIAVFQFSHVFGVNASTAELSRSILMWNICTIPLMAFLAHWFFLIMEKAQEYRRAIWVIYISGAVLFFIHLFVPSSYLLLSTAKMYFPYYYVPGNLQWLSRIWFHVVASYALWVMLQAYTAATDPIRKNRYLFILLATVIGILVGQTAVLLTYEIPFDPIWSSLFGLGTFVLAYAMLKFQLLEVKVIVERALVYAMLVTVTIGLIFFAEYSTSLAHSFMPEMPDIVIPLLASIFAVGVGFFIRNKLRESDDLKYEFITVIAHKFRTPLTQTKWAAEELFESETDPERKQSIGYIRQSNEHLISMTGALIELADTDKGVEQLYHFEKIKLIDLIHEVAANATEEYANKGVKLSIEDLPSAIYALVDKDKFSFILMTLVDNACSYTPEGGTVSLGLSTFTGKVRLTVKDSGIGISREDLSRIFSKFYRTKQAKLADTEGFGVGLYLARSIARRHSGSIEVSSDGEGKGTTFTVVIPLAE